MSAFPKTLFRVQNVQEYSSSPLLKLQMLCLNQFTYFPHNGQYLYQKVHPEWDVCSLRKHLSQKTWKLVPEECCCRNDCPPYTFHTDQAYTSCQPLCIQFRQLFPLIVFLTFVRCVQSFCQCILLSSDLLILPVSVLIPFGNCLKVHYAPNLKRYLSLALHNSKLKS